MVGEDDPSSTYLTFDLGEHILGIEVQYVREILDMQKITRLPNVPAEVHGVVDLRGVSVPIIDLKSRLGVPPHELGDEARIVVVEVGTDADYGLVGVLADRVRNVDQIGAHRIEKPPSVGMRNWDLRIVRGLSRSGSDLIVLIDITHVFSVDGVEIDLGSGTGIF